MGDDEPRIGVVDDMLQDATPVRQVDRHVDGAEVVEPEPDTQGVRPIGQPGQDGIALLDTQAAQSHRSSAGGLARLAIGPGAPIREEGEDLVRRLRRAPLQERPEHAFDVRGHPRIMPRLRHAVPPP